MKWVIVEPNGHLLEDSYGEPTMAKPINLQRLYLDLMKACYRAEVLAGKCEKVGLRSSVNALNRAARDFDAAAERVAQLKSQQ